MDYRKSHINPQKGVSYDLTFSQYPYRKLVWEWEKEILLHIINNLDEDSDRSRYLDFACGTGRILSFLEHYFEDSYGIDVSKSMLNVAKEKIARGNLFLGDITREKIFEENFFDVITAFRFFLNAEQDLKEDSLREIKKIIKNNGLFIFNIHMISSCILVKELKFYQWLKKLDRSNFNVMSFNDVKNLVENNGFRIVDRYHFGVIPIYSDKFNLFLRQIKFLETVFSKMSLFLPLSRYVIFVCQPL